MRDINVKSFDGIDIAARDYGGDGPNVVLLHGAMRNLEDWRSVLPHLGNMRVVAMDQRFHGHSGIGPTSTPDDWVRDIEAVVDQAGLSNPYVVGHSLGGVNALMYGVAHPQCPGIVDIDGYDFRQRELYDELPDEEADAFLKSFAGPSVPAFMQEDSGDDAWRDQQMQMLGGMDAEWSVEPEQTRAVLERSFVKTSDGRWQRCPPLAFWTAITQTGPADLLDLLERVACPVTMVVCTRGMMPPPSGTDYFTIARQGLVRHTRRIAAAKPNVRAEAIDATHGVIYEKPEEIAKLIRSMAST